VQCAQEATKSMCRGPAKILGVILHSAKKNRAQCAAQTRALSESMVGVQFTDQRMWQSVRDARRRSPAKQCDETTPTFLRMKSHEFLPPESLSDQQKKV
jgi:hypothetical protein